MFYYLFEISRYPALFDMTKMCKDRLDMQGLEYYRILELEKSQRVMKSHLHWSLLPEEIRNGSKQPKVFTTIYIQRNMYTT